MNFYSLDDKGNLIDRSELEFDDNHVYLIDDIEKKTLYIWVGLEVPQYKKDLTAAWARKFDNDRGGACKILIMMQKREYGSFLSMMNQLKKGLIPGESTERRPELVLSAPKETAPSTSTISENKAQDKKTTEIKEEDAEPGVLAWLAQLKKHRAPITENEEVEAKESMEKEAVSTDDEDIGLKSQIREGAYYLSLKKYSYNDLCWLLAEVIQNIAINMPTLEDIRKKAEEVFNSSSTYDELCWLNAQMDILIDQQFLEKKKKYN
ncbi:MAG: hypothetical protein KGD72_12100 [Candidatus Lokiarchaeota archaeon]|nr:hypothetical protein [Candidatus Lokiarchaeota archaeon]